MTALAPVTEKKFLTVAEVAVVVERDPETIRRVLRSGEMHGSQRVKGGSWRVRPACAEAWADGLLCSHSDPKMQPVSLRDFRMRRAGGRA